jgi:hypothetical protein
VAATRFSRATLLLSLCERCVFFPCVKMHQALPPRKSSNPAAYMPRSTRLRSFRRSRLKYIILLALGIGATVLVCFRSFAGSERIPSGTPPVVIVTVFESPMYSKLYTNGIKENREEYAKRHGKIHGVGSQELSATCRNCTTVY